MGEEALGQALRGQRHSKFLNTSPTSRTVGRRGGRSPCLSFKEDSFSFAICSEVDILVWSKWRGYVGRAAGRPDRCHLHTTWSPDVGAILQTPEHFLTWSSENAQMSSSAYSLVRLRWLNSLVFGLPLPGRAWGITLITFPYHLPGKGETKRQLESERERRYFYGIWPRLVSRLSIH